MTKTTLKTLTALTVAATLTLSLAACSPETGPFEFFDETAATPEATQEPVLDPMDLDGNGSVSEFEKQMAAKNAVRDYTLPDGTVVQVDPTQPFPEAVHSAVKAETVPLIAATQAFGTKAQYEVAMIAELDAKAAAMGRGIAVVFESSIYGGGTMWVILASGQSQAPFIGSADKASVVAQAETWTENRNYELIIH